MVVGLPADPGIFEIRCASQSWRYSVSVFTLKHLSCPIKRMLVAFHYAIAFLMLLVCGAELPEPELQIVQSFHPGVAIYRTSAIVRLLSKFPAPYYSSVTVGNARSGKSRIGNLRVALRHPRPVPAEATFLVCDGLEPCTKGINVIAVSRTDGSGTDLLFDFEGGSLAEDHEVMSHLLTVGACISSGPLVLMDTELNDNTLQLVGRLAAHLLDQTKNGGSCSFREGGPVLAIVVNKNDGAVRQEAEPGGLRVVWDTLTAARIQEAVVINQVFTNVQLFALPYEKDEWQLRSPSSEFAQKVRSIDHLLMAATQPTTIVSESNAAVRFEGTPAAIVAAVFDIIVQSNSNDRGNVHGAPRLRDFIIQDASRAARSCRDEFHSAIAQRTSPACAERCSGEGHSCQVVHEWLAPARAAAEKCFVDATAKWREGGNRFGASVLDPALQQLNADTQHRADELHSAWQQANSVDPARTQHESRTREEFRKTPQACGGRYGDRCHFGGPRSVQDFCTYGTFVHESRSCTFKRCGAFLGCADWTVTSRWDKEVGREQRTMCVFDHTRNRDGCRHRQFEIFPQTSANRPLR